jgi:glycine amidinotransferase
MANPETRRTFVESEFAPLRTVVLAQSEFAGSERLSRHDPELAFLDPQELDRLVAVRGKNHAEVFPERQAAWEVERENLAAVFTRNGLEVLRPRLLTEDEKADGQSNGCSNFFVRDPWFTVGGSVIEGSLRLRHRRREVLPSRPILFDRALSTAESYIAVPQPELDGHAGSSGNGPYIEGGDVLVLDDHVFVGHSGLASEPTHDATKCHRETEYSCGQNMTEDNAWSAQLIAAFRRQRAPLQGDVVLESAEQTQGHFRAGARPSLRDSIDTARFKIC